MAKTSAGILMYRPAASTTSNPAGNAGIEVLLVHPGGPYWARKDAAAWTIPKGEYEGDEDALAAAQREFQEETGFPVAGDFLPLGSQRQRSGKVISAWAVAGDCDAARVVSNMFSMEWPPRSGHMREFPEVDRAGWFSLTEAHEKLIAGQRPFLLALMEQLGIPHIVFPSDA